MSFAVSLLVAGVVAPRAGQAQDDQLLQQQLIQQEQAQQQAQQQAQLAQDQAQLIQQQMQQNMDQQQAQLQASNQTVVIPEHLQVGNQRFDASVAGFRAYLESVKSSDPGLYGQLAPDAARLEAREDSAKAVLAAGVVVGLASAIYGVVGGDDCTEPSVTDPNFAADSQAWGACNERNVTKMATFGVLGVGAIIVGSLVAYARRPTHQDLMDLVNKNNRLSKQPLQWQVGYDPTQRFAFTGATVSF
ncbi:MAG TPA: hypothetical protein VHO06_18795 [Polyangia bacterium]|nr:hypothetical protein [Polyangia bacterium]